MDATLVSELAAAIHSSDPVSGLTHDFYRYPARFSPIFAGLPSEHSPGRVTRFWTRSWAEEPRSLKQEALGRHAIGTDISLLPRGLLPLSRPLS